MRLLRRHWLFAVLLAGGAAIRVVVTLAYRPALFYVDSTRYLNLVAVPDPGDRSPLGYPYLVLWPLLHGTHTLGSVPVAQHLLGLAFAVGAYALLLRWGAWPWLAAVATVPMLFDAYQLQIEQMIMSETLFETLLLAVLLLLGWRRRPGHVAAALAGLAVAAIVLTRLLGYPCLVVVVVFLLLAGRSWRRVTTAAVAVVAFAVPMLGYVAYFESWNPGSYRVTKSDTLSAYSRVAPVADCRRFEVPDYERVLCDPRPRDQRPGPEFYHNDDDRPVKRLRPPPGVTVDEAVHDFTWRVVRHQPLDVAGAVGYDFLRGFWWTKTTEHGEPSVHRWLFSPREYEHTYDVTGYLDRWGGGDVRVDTRLAGFLVTYQKYVFLRGTLMGVCLLLAVGGAVGLFRARRSGLRARVALAAALPGCTLVMAAAVEFSWRYQLPGIVLFPVAGALGVVAMARGATPSGSAGDDRRRRSGRRPARRPADAAATS